MISTSDYYKANVDSTVTKWVPKLVIDYSDYNLDNTIEVSQSFPADISFPAQIADGIRTPSYKYFSWASFEWGCHLPSTDDNFEHGAISQQLSGADKTFPENTPTFYGATFYSTEPSSLMAEFIPKPIFSVTFLERSLTSLEVVFDDKLVEYAEEFKIYVYQGTTLAHTETVTGNTGTTWNTTLASQIDDVTRLDLVLDKWSVAGTWGRVLEFFTSVQETYLQGDILSLSINEETSPKKASIPIGNVTANTCEVSLINKNSRFDNDNDDSPLQGNLIKNRRLMPYIGLVGDNNSITGKQNYIPLGTFYSQEWTNDNFGLAAACNGRDIVQLMDESEYKTSQFITPPVDQNVTYTTTADFDAFTKFNTISENNEIRFGGTKYIYNSTVGNFYTRTVPNMVKTIYISNVIKTLGNGNIKTLADGKIKTIYGQNNIKTLTDNRIKTTGE